MRKPTQLFLDYVGNGIWALAGDPSMQHPRVEVYADPIRLIQEYATLGCEIVLSPMAGVVCDNYTLSIPWQQQIGRVNRYEHPE